MLTAELTIWTIHLDDADARRPKMARKPRAVAARTLHANADQRPVPGEPGQELAVAGACRRKQSCSEQLPGHTQCCGSMHILMRVNATDHVLIDIRHSHGVAMLRSSAKCARARRVSGQDSDGRCLHELLSGHAARLALARCRRANKSTDQAKDTNGSAKPGVRLARGDTSNILTVKTRRTGFGKTVDPRPDCPVVLIVGRQSGRVDRTRPTSSIGADAASLRPSIFDARRGPPPMSRICP